jgi:hypothetical protein
MQQVVGEEALPLNRAKSPIEPYQRRVILPITPSKLTAMERNFLEGHIVDPSPKPAHHRSIQILVVPVRFIINKIEVPRNQPWALTSVPDLS